jgi:hypothetical protein
MRANDADRLLVDSFCPEYLHNTLTEKSLTPIGVWDTLTRVVVTASLKFCPSLAFNKP